MESSTTDTILNIFYSHVVQVTLKGNIYGRIKEKS